MVQVFNKRTILTALFIMVLAAALISSYYFYNKYQQVQSLIQKSKKMTQEESLLLLKKIGKHTLLPANEQPTFAKVADSRLLKDQSFFDKAENGDRVIIYSLAKKAILYRPSIDKIIEMGPILQQPTTQSASLKNANSNLILPSFTVDNPMRIAIYNGGKIPGNALKVEEKLKLIFKDQVSIVTKVNAQKSYTKNIIFNLNASNKNAVQVVASNVNAEITEGLPTDEDKPDADILIIIVN